MTDRCPPFDRVLLATSALVLGGLGALTLATTPLGAVDRGWADGTYQRAYEERFENTLPTAQAAAQLLAALKLTVLREVAEGAVLGRDGWLFTAEEFTPPASPRPLGAELERVRTALAADGIALLPLIVPDKARVMAERLPRGRSAAFEARYDAALETIAAAGLPVLDLRPALRDLGAPFMRTDTHWSPAGAEAAARVIAAENLARGPQLTRAETRHDATGVVPFEGDLLAFADTGASQGRAALSGEEIATFDTHVAAAGGLFGDAPVDVVLVGTSFSGRAAFHFEGFLKHHLQADVLNLAEVGLGPFVPMDCALAALPDLPTIPRLVIWEIPERYLPLADTAQSNTP